MNISTEFDSLLLSLIATYVRIMETSHVAYLIVAVGIVYLYALFRGRRHFLKGFGLILPVSLVAYMALIAIAYRFSGLYAYAKLVWTLAAFLPIIIIPTILFTVDNGKIKGLRPTKMFGLIVAFTLIATNAVSKLSTTVIWLANPYGVVMKHFNTSTSGQILLFIDSIITSRAQHEASSFAFHRNSPWNKLDQKSMVFAGNLYSFLLSQGYQCVNCRFSKRLLDFRGFTHVQDSDLIDIDLVIRIDDIAE